MGAKALDGPPAEDPASCKADRTGKVSPSAALALVVHPLHKTKAETQPI